MRANYGRFRTLAVAVLSLVPFVGCAMADIGGAGRNDGQFLEGSRFGKVEDDMQMAKILVATRADLDALQATVMEATSEASQSRVQSLMNGLKLAPKNYDHSSHYLAFILAYLQDERVLPDNDQALTKGLGRARNSITDVLPRKGIDFERLDPGRYDVNALREEFHAGGALSDPEAGDGLLDAIHVLSENFRSLGDDEALIVMF